MLTLEQFLISVEKKAFRIAQLAVKNEADALDVVQESMIKLAQSYGHWQGDEQSLQWKPLFYKILQNRIMDFHRSHNRYKRWLINLFPTTHNDDDDRDFQERSSLAYDFDPLNYLEQEQAGKQALITIEALPIRQQQCFLLRNWEGFSVKETADILEISTGSVKTHHFRALKKIQQALYEQ